MKTNASSNSPLYSRRDFAKLAATALPAACLAGSSLPSFAAEAAKPNSVIKGVQIGIIAPYSTSGASSAEDILKFVVNAGLSGVELQSAPAEGFAGAPGAGGRGGGPGGGRGGGAGLPGATPEQQAAITAMNTALAEKNAAVNTARAALSQASFSEPASVPDRLRELAKLEAELATARAEEFAKLQGSPQRLNAQQVQSLVASAAPPTPGPRGGPGGPGGGRGGNPAVAEWRKSVSMEKFVALRKLYNDAGVTIYAFKMDSGLGNLTDDECDYTFKVAKALGANHVTMEIVNDAATLKRNAEFAGKHQIYVAYHNHSAPSYDAVIAAGPYSGINLDVGHFTGAYGKSPIPIIEKYHDRILSMHFKDKRYTAVNVPWGQGDTPLAEVLRLMAREKYKFPATIEKEYPTPAGSDQLTEIKKCLQFARDALA